MIENDAIIFLTYDVRAGTDLAEYRAFLREVDSPFFNAQPGVVCYENWETVAVTSPPPAFPFFDIIYVEALETAAEIFTTPVIQDFSAEWHARWGQDPAPTPETMAGNYHAAIYRRIGNPARARGASIGITYCSGADNSPAVGPDMEHWSLHDSLVGNKPARRLIISYATDGGRPAGRDVVGQRITTR